METSRINIDLCWTASFLPSEIHFSRDLVQNIKIVKKEKKEGERKGEGGDKAAKVNFEIWKKIFGR